MLTIFQLTLVEARRRRIVTAALICGSVLLAAFAAGMYFANRGMENQQTPFLERQVTLAILTLAGCYATNFLVALFAILLPIDALSGEIDSGVIQTVAAKPIRRADVVIGKWAGYGVIASTYAVGLVGGIFVVARLMASYVPDHIVGVLALQLLEVALLLSLSIAGGTRLSTVTNAIMCLAFYGIAFMGGWIEQIGAVAGVQAARNVGIALSLISPVDSLWRLGSYYLQPALVRDSQQSPFISASVPNALMLWWAIGMTVALLALAVRQFSRRAL